MDDVHGRSEAAKRRLQNTFKKNPELREAFRQSVAELRKPENMKPMLDSAVRLFEALQAMRKGGE